MDSAKQIGTIIICLSAGVACGTKNVVPPEVAAAKTSVQHAGAFVASAQDTTAGSPTFGSLMPGHPPVAVDNITGVAGAGLLVQWQTTRDPAFREAAKAAGDFLLQNTGDLHAADPLFLVELSKLTGDPKYADAVNNQFFIPLQNGTYVRNGVAVNTQQYAADVLAAGSGTEVNMGLWNLAHVARAAALLQVVTAHDFLAVVETGLNELHPGALGTTNDVYWQTASLAHGAFAIQQAKDPDHFVCAGTNDPALKDNTIQQLADLIANSQLHGGDTDGAFPYVLGSASPVDDAQTTAYAVTFLAQFGTKYSAQVAAGAAYLQRLQQPDGSILQGVGAGPVDPPSVGPEVAAEAALAILAAFPDAVLSSSAACRDAAAHSVGTLCPL